MCLSGTVLLIFTLLLCRAEAAHASQETMEIHHGKHHAAYVTNLNKQIEGKELDSKSLEEVPLS
jgi:superoxide dismutase